MYNRSLFLAIFPYVSCHRLFFCLNHEMIKWHIKDSFIIFCSPFLLTTNKYLQRVICYCYKMKLCSVYDHISSDYELDRPIAHLFYRLYVSICNCSCFCRQTIKMLLDRQATISQYYCEAVTHFYRNSHSRFCCRLFCASNYYSSAINTGFSVTACGTIAAVLFAAVGQWNHFLVLSSSVVYCSHHSPRRSSVVRLPASLT